MEHNIIAFIKPFLLLLYAPVKNRYLLLTNLNTCDTLIVEIGRGYVGLSFWTAVYSMTSVSVFGGIFFITVTYKSKETTDSSA